MDRIVDRVSDYRVLPYRSSLSRINTSQIENYRI
jgi:hypothetical protein